MGRPINLRVNRAEFDETLNRYRGFSKRDPKKICDTKAFFIARRWVLEIPKADKGRIQGDLGKFIKATKRRSASMSLRTVKRYSRFGLEVQAPLVALIINKRRGKGRGLYGAAMAAAAKALLAGRLRSIAFLKSSILPAIRALLPYADTRGAPRADKSPVQIGAEKGFGIPAAESWQTKATIGSTASTKRDKKQALFKYGEPALQRAFDAETQSMLDYMERKLRETAAKAGVKTK